MLSNIFPKHDVRLIGQYEFLLSFCFLGLNSGTVVFQSSGKYPEVQT